MKRSTTHGKRSSDASTRQSPRVVDASTREAARIAEAAQWRLIGILLERPRAGWHAEVAALAVEVGDEDLRAAAALAESATEGEYLRLVGPGGAVSPREVTYRPFADPGHLLAELVTVYDAFAFRPRAEDPVDHVAVEVAFVGYLLLKEAYAAARGERERVATTVAAREAFVEAHLTVFAPAVAERLRPAEPSYLVATARLLAERVPQRPAADSRAPADLPDLCRACTTPPSE